MKRAPSMPRGGALLILAWGASLLSGCAADPAEEEVSVSQHALFMSGARWPANGNGVYTVPVCFNFGSTIFRPEADAVRQRVIRAVARTWAANANLAFTGYGLCFTAPKGKVMITLVDSRNHQEVTPPWLGYQGGESTAEVTLPVDSEYWEIGHLFGHILGFAHEEARPDFNGSCSEPAMSGSNLGTSPDAYSIMSKCRGNTLSAWDVIGLHNAYGRKPEGSLVSIGGRCLDVPRGEIVDQNTPNLYDCQGGTNQKWTHIQANDGLAVTGGGITKCLDVPASNNADGTSPTLYGCHGQANQSWAIRRALIRGYGGKCIVLSGGTQPTMGECFGGNYGTWTFTTAGQIRESYGDPDSRCLEARNSDVVIAACTGEPNQVFTMLPGGRLLVLGRCVGASSTAGSLYTYVCDGTDSQRWSTTGPLRSLDKCLTPPDAFSSTSAPTLQYCTEGEAQAWDYTW